MGAVLGLCSVASWIPCLCSGASCLLCQCCPSTGNSTVTRIVYAFLALLGTVLSCIMLTPGISDQLNKVPGFCEGGFGTQIPHVNGYVDCNVLVGYKAVYRVGFAMSIFFLALCLLMIRVRTSKDPRAAIHNGFWFFKVLALVGIMVGAFYIPEGPFTRAWFWIGAGGAFSFILIQLIFLVDFAHTVNESLVDRMENGNSKCWYAVLFSITSLCYILSVTFIVIFYMYYTKSDGCTENKFFISFNLILCFIVSVISILPKVQEYQPRSGLLQSSFITLYTVYLTWSAMTNEPDRNCNPSLMSLLSQITAPGTNSGNATAVIPTPEPPKSLQWWDTQSIIGLVLFVLCLIYSSIRNSTNSQVNKLTLSSSDTGMLDDTTGGSDTEDGGVRRVLDNEKDGVQYSYSVFLLMLSLASLYIMMTLTNWYSPDADSNTMTSKWPAVWVKMVSSWVCLLLYVWTLVAPLLLPNRDFS